VTTPLASAAWPPNLRALAAAIGEDAVARLVDAYAGQRVYIPIRPPRGGHRLAELLGGEALAQLQQDFGGAQIEIPLARPAGALKAAIAAAEGTTSEVAARLGCSRRYARLFRNG
jgi:hypothetical protein